MRTMAASGAGADRSASTMSLTDAGKAKILEWLRSSDKAVVGQAIFDDLTTDFRSDVTALAGRPIAVVYAMPGAEQAAMIKGLYEDAYAKVPGVTLVPIEKSAHFVMLDQPDAFAAAVRDFLKK
jgi:pimeloyl-ACP methyl ester carboxylesterase